MVSIPIMIPNRNCIKNRNIKNRIRQFGLMVLVPIFPGPGKEQIKKEKTRNQERGNQEEMD